MELPNSEILYISVDGEPYESSAHGIEGITCVECHIDARDYPHKPLKATSIREYSLQHYSTCAEVDCHPDVYEETLNSTHQRAMEDGNIEAAICTDCHNPHDMVSPNTPRSRIPATCERCHSQISGLYMESAHGTSLINEENPDVPTCIDCHGVHDIQDPSTNTFRLFSTQLCADCHNDPELMEPYEINIDVFETYISDFHGTTVILFQSLSPEQETNKPVCIDCHGVHEMRKVDDAESQVMKENLLTTCQKCHPDASPNFPDAWLSHYIPTPKNAPLVYFVNLFYKIFIPSTVGGLLLFVISDSARRLLGRRKGGQDV
jgi:predicted CXXCH cytochrome family protein